ncbi:MAG: hypothetical protein JRI68_09595 [Deltaproteobacteria bacterium]|nr:hypothetical protein [Deltaproteobacteria bacterium]
MLALCLCGTVAAVSCSDDGDDNGTTTSSSSTTTTSSSTSTSTSSGIGGGGGCDIDLTQSLGSSQECNDCMAGECCEASEALEANPTMATFQQALLCADHHDPLDPDYGCVPECTAYACDDTYSSLLMNDCTDCVNQNCCAEWSACAADIECAQCDTAFNFQPSCCNNAAYAAWNGCGYDACASVCHHELWGDEECTGGTGGSGTGGAGGSGGSGGAGGSGGS